MKDIPSQVDKSSLQEYLDEWSFDGTSFNTQNDKKNTTAKITPPKIKDEFDNPSM